MAAASLFLSAGTAIHGAPANQTWSNGGSGTWDTTTSNWSGTWTNGNDALFQNGGATTVAIQSAGISADAVESYNNGTNLTLNGGTLTLTSTATGNSAGGTAGTDAILSTNNNATIVANANLLLGAAGGSTQTINISGGQIEINGGISDAGAGNNLTVTNNSATRTFQLNGTTTLAGTTGLTLTAGGGTTSLYALGGNTTLSGAGAKLNLQDSGSNSEGALYILGGTNSFNGGINLQSGVLSVSNSASLGGAITFNGGTSGGSAGVLWVSGTGLTSFTGTTVSFASNVDTQIGVAAGSSFNANVTLTGGSGNNGDFEKYGPGTLTISGNNNTYNRWTYLAGGTTVLDYSTNNNNKISSNTTFLEGTNLQLNGGSYSQSDGSTTLAVTSESTFGTTSTMGSSSTISRTGGGSSTINLGGLFERTGNTVDVITAGVANTSTSNTNGILGPWATFGSGTSMQYATGGGVIAGYSGGTALPATGGSATSNYTLTSLGQTLTSSESAYTLQYTGTSGGGILALAGNTFTLNGLLNTGTDGLTISGSGSLVIGASAGVANNELIFTGPGNTSVSSVISGGGALTDSDSGTLTLTGANTYTGNNYFNAGTVAINANASLGAVATGSAVYLDGGTLQEISGSGAVTLDNGGANKRNVVLGPNGGSINVQGTDALTVDGTVLGYQINLSGGLTKTGTGTLILSGSNSFNGGLYLNGGTVQLANGSALGTGGASLNSVAFGAASNGTLNLGGNTITVLGLTGDSTADVNNGGSNATLTDNVIGNLTSNTFGGILANGSGGALSFTKDGAGTLILTGANTYTGATTIVAGSLQLGNGTTDGVIAGGSNIADNGLGSLIFDNVNAESYSGVISGVGSVTKIGAGAQTVSGANTFTGGLTVNNGTFIDASSGTGLGGTNVAANTVAIGSLGTVQLNIGSNLNYNYSFSGSGRLLFDFSAGGDTTTSTTAFNGFTGTIELNNTVSNGNKLQLTGQTGVSGATLQIDNGATAFVSSGTTTFGAITVVGTGNSENRGAIRLNTGTLGGNISLLGSTTIGNEGGTITGNITSGLTTGTQTLTMGTSNSTGTAILSGNIGDGILGGHIALVAATGTTTLSGANTYTGGTIIDGTVKLGSSSALSTGAVENHNGGTLDLNGQTFGNALIHTTSGNNEGTITNTSAATATVTSGYNLAAASGFVISDFTITGTGNINWSGAIDRTQFNGNVTKSGTNTLTLTGAGSGYQGEAYIVNGGTLAFNMTNGSTFNSGGITNTANLAGTETVGVTNTISSVISGTAGTFVQSGAGTTILSGANSFTGGTTLSAGELALNNGSTGSTTTSAIGTGALTISGGTIDSTVAGITLGTNNTQNWNGDFTFLGTQSLNLGTGAVTLGSTRQVTVAANTLTEGGVISGTGFGLTKAGSGTLTLTGANTETGATIINGGTLSTGATGILANGGLASSIGASTNAATNLVLNGGTLQDANTGAAESTDRLFTLTANGGTIDSSGSNALTIAGNGTGAADALAYTGSGARTLTLTGTNGATNILAPIIADGTGGATSVVKSGTGQWALTGANTYTGSVTLNSGILFVGNGNGNGYATGATPLGNGGTVTLNGGTLDFGSSMGGFTILSSTFNNAITVASAASIGQYDGNDIITGAFTVNAALNLFSTYNNKDINFNGAFAGSGPINIGAGSFSGAQFSYAFTGSNTTYNGTITDTTTGPGGAQLIIGTNTALQNASIVVNGNGTAASQFGSGYVGTSLIFAGAGTSNPNTGNFFGTATTSVTAPVLGSLAGSSNIILQTTDSSSAAVSLTVGGNNSSTTYSGVASGTGALTKTGTGTMTLTGANSYSGVTTVSGGTLALSGSGAVASTSLVVNSPGVYDLSQVGAQTYGDLSGSGTVNLGANILTIGDAANTTFSGSINDGGIAGGFGAGLVYNGSGVFTIAGVNTYTGGTTINSGTLQLGVNNSINNASSVIVAGGALAMNGFSDTVAAVSLQGGSAITGPGTLTSTSDFDLQSGSVSAVLAGSVGADIDGSSVVTLSGANTYTGTTLVSGNSIVNFQNGTAFGTNSAISVANFGTVQVQGGITGGSKALSIRGNGATSLSATGALENVSGNNSFGGAITLTGTTAFASDAGILTLTGGVTTGGNALTVKGPGNVVESGAITGLGSVTTGSAVNLMLTGANTYTGATSIGSGTTFQLGNGGTTGSLSTSSTVTDNGTFVIDRSNRVAEGTDFTSGLSGSGSLQQIGTGTTTLGVANSYSGGTSVSAGALLVTNSSGSATGTGAVGVTGSSATLGGTGKISGAITLSSGGSLYSGAVASGTPATGPGTGMTLSSALNVNGGNLSFALNAGGAASLASPNTTTSYFTTSSTVSFTGTDSITLVDLTNGNLTLRMSQPYLLISASSNSMFSGLVTEDSTGALSLDGNGNVLGVWQGGALTNYTTITFKEFGSDGVTPLAQATSADPGYYAPSLYLINGDLEVVPEPGTWALMIGGLALLIVIQRRRNKIG